MYGRCWVFGTVTDIPTPAGGTTGKINEDGTGGAAGRAPQRQLA
jgi:hypothetical protein